MLLCPSLVLGNLSILAICIGVASGVLLVLLILFTLVLTRRGNGAGEDTHHNTTIKATRCQSSSSDVKTSAVLLDTKDNHERMFPETTERGSLTCSSLPSSVVGPRKNRKEEALKLLTSS